MSEIKQIVSLRIENSNRLAVQATASRLYVRESDIYRFAVDYLLNRFSCLLDEATAGSDLLPFFLDIRSEINQSLDLKKHQLFKIINGNATHPDKFVAMADIELLLMPQHLLKQRLVKVAPQDEKNLDVDIWLKNYLLNKYDLVEMEIGA